MATEIRWAIYSVQALASFKDNFEQKAGKLTKDTSVLFDIWTHKPENKLGSQSSILYVNKQHTHIYISFYEDWGFNKILHY